MKSFISTAFIFATGLAVFADESAEQLVRATYKLTNESSTATCLIISRGKGKNETRHLVTAHHVLSQMKGDFCRLISRVKNGDATWHRKEIRLPIREIGKDLWKKHPDHDLAVLPIPDSTKLEALPFECLATDESFEEIHTGDRVLLAVFPEKVESNGAGFPLLRNGVISSYPLVPVKPHPVIKIDMTAWSGDSGGPVIHESKESPDGGPLVIAFVRGLINITDTEKESRFVERRTHYPLGISEVLHAVLVREMLEEKKKEE